MTHSILVIQVLFLKFFNPFLEKSTGHFKTEKHLTFFDGVYIVRQLYKLYIIAIYFARKLNFSHPRLFISRGRAYSCRRLCNWFCLFVRLFVSQQDYCRTRTQYASPPEGNAIPAGHVLRAEAIITKSCVVEEFVTHRPKTFITFS